MGEVDDDNIPGRSSQQSHPELERLGGINWSDDLGMVVSITPDHLQGWDTGWHGHFPECRAIPPDQLAVEDRMGQEAGL